ncbi:MULTISPECIES: DUF4350 domain-containing protein [unclassified Streptomyces]|uniref:DUF4350 domain-containing protein n=1 Tax=unclassified Streptomyces TaxID=2593676 RepID=UPI003806FD26
MTTAQATTPAPASTSASPTAHQLWSRWRAVLAAGLALVLFGVAYAVLQSGENHHALDPRSPDPAGSRALAQLLGHRGVTTTVVTTTDDAASSAGPDTTLLVTVPDLLTDRQQSRLRKAMTQSGGGRTVLLDPSDASVGVLAPGVHYAGPASVRTRRAGCDLPAAVRAGDADLGGTAYTTTAEGADRCYRTAAGNPTLLRLPAADGGDIVVLGTHTLLQNENLRDQGNASLALQVLGAHPHLVWYLPSLDDAAAFDGGRQSFLDLIPDGWSWAFLQLLVAAAFAALWRARRLGPIVAERLPATVRAAEATEGRARLYRRGNARARAAEALRTATRDRLAPLLGIPPSQAHDPGVLASAVAARLDDPAAQPHVTLHGPPPADDAALLRLADDLDALERRILRNERKATP